MAATQNYSLPLPQLGEPADIRVLDQGTEMIDGIMHGNRTMVAPAWVSTETYNTGNRVVYLGEYYKCKADNVTGAWDATKWDKTTVGEDIEGLGTGGASALADLDDVEITSPTDGQALLFDDDDDKWKNGTLPDPSVTKTATGNPIELTDAASAPMVKCVTEIQGSQDLHGYDKPWVGGAGKNKLNASDTTVNNGYVFNDTSVNLSPGTYTFSVFVTGTPTASKQINIMDRTGESSVLGFTTIRAGRNTITFTTETPITSVASFTNTTDSVDISEIQIESGSSFTTFAPYSNICPITAYTEGEIEVRGRNLSPLASATSDSSGNIRAANGTIYNGIENGKTYTVSFDMIVAQKSTVAEGNRIGIWLNDTGTSLWRPPITTTGHQTFTFTATDDGEINFWCTGAYDGNTKAIDNIQIEEGSVEHDYEPYTSTTHTTTYPSAIYRGSEDCVGGTETHDMVVVDLGDLTWVKNTTIVIDRYYATISDMKYVSAYTVANIISSSFGTVSLSDMNNNLLTDMIAGYTTQIYISTERGKYATEADFKTAMSGVQLAYELATPTTSSVTPTNTPIKSLSGYNHIESSTGDMEVEYISGNYQALVDLIQSSSHVYSTAEQVVGKWIDGSTVYERVIEYATPFTIANDTWYTSTESYTGISKIVNAWIINADGAIYNGIIVLIQNDKLVIGNQTKTQPINNLKYVILRYTKTTQTRSLSAPVTSQKAQIEPLSEKEEEVPTEEEKAVEMPVVDEPIDETVDETEEESDER